MSCFTACQTAHVSPISLSALIKEANSSLLTYKHIASVSRSLDANYRQLRARQTFQFDGDMQDIYALEALIQREAIDLATLQAYAKELRPPILTDQEFAVMITPTSLLHLSEEERAALHTIITPEQQDLIQDMLPHKN
jgi:hypothetical protein